MGSVTAKQSKLLANTSARSDHMPVKPELIGQIEHAIAKEAEDDGLQWLRDEDDGSGAERLQLHKQMDQGYREASQEWAKAETALSKVLKSKREDQDDFHLPPCDDAKPQSAASSPAFCGLDPEERARRLEAVRAGASAEKARQLRFRASEAGKKLQDHAKRRLRVKISEILREVHRRQNLRQRQEKLKAFRAQRARQGLASGQALGDADHFALGLGEDLGLEDATPRRRCILESLGLEELDLVRKDPRWYLEADPEMEDAGGGNRERLIDFFTPARKDKHVSIECYAQRLRQRLAAACEVAFQDTQDTDSWQSLLGSWHSKGAHQSGMHSSGMSTCLPGDSQMSSVSIRREPIRDDKASPTMQKVWEKYRRKEERDAQVMEARRLAAEERMAKNAFKVSQQIRDYASTQSKYKELHQQRLQEAVERKAAREAEVQERLAVMDEFKLRRMRRALTVADEKLEQKRDRVTEGLEVWEAGVVRSQLRAHAQERRARDALRASQEAYHARLEKVGETRSEKTESQAQKNDKLKARIQVSLMQQLEEQRKLECDRQAVATEEKLEAARLRRFRDSNKYNFLEKAFGEQVKFDHKFSFTPTLKDGWHLKGNLSSSAPTL
ncbi:unnamed protein product [Effrenium voratum]|uniref:Uncharacterized protein n=1 Tax=Effrenium voratum TaxID=2562239 RepID=A0AA36HNS7_9DINO|nr:unnamed protein product [Effrenium voratum]